MQTIELYWETVWLIAFVLLFEIAFCVCAVIQFKFYDKSLTIFVAHILSLFIIRFRFYQVSFLSGRIHFCLKQPGQRSFL